jgi:cation transport ATPase
MRPPAPGPREPAAYSHDERGRDDRSLGDLFKELGRETQMLVRQEVQLAKAEVSRSVSKAGKHAGFIAAGGFVAYAGLIGLVMALGFLLGTFMPVWLGFLIAGVVVLIIGYALFQKGLSGIKNTDFSLEHTAETLQEDKLWLKQEAQEVKRDPKNLGSDR